MSKTFICTSCGELYAGDRLVDLGAWRHMADGSMEHKCRSNHPQSGHFKAILYERHLEEQNRRLAEALQGLVRSCKYIGSNPDIIEASMQFARIVLDEVGRQP